MTPWQLGGLDTQPVAGDPSRPRGIHDPVLGTDDRHGLDLWPCVELGNVTPHRALEPQPRDGRVGEVGRTVVVEHASSTGVREAEPALGVELEV